MIECLTPEPAQRLAACNAIVDPAASSYFVYRVDLGTNELQMTNHPTIPVFSLSGSPRPAGSVLTAFLNGGSSYIATASSGGLFEQTGPRASGTVPEPCSLLLVAAVIAGAAGHRSVEGSFSSLGFRPGIGITPNRAKFPPAF